MFEASIYQSLLFPIPSSKFLSFCWDRPFKKIKNKVFEASTYQSLLSPFHQLNSQAFVEIEPFSSLNIENIAKQFQQFHCQVLVRKKKQCILGLETRTLPSRIHSH